MRDLSEFRRGAQLLEQLRRLPPGMSIQVTKIMLDDITVPANPMDNIDAQYIVEWLHGRMPFYCTVMADIEIMPSKWTFHRPKEAPAFAACVGGPLDGTSLKVDHKWITGNIVMLRGKVRPVAIDDPIFRPMSAPALARMTEPIFYYRWDGTNLIWPEKK